MLGGNGPVGPVALRLSVSEVWRLGCCLTEWGGCDRGWALWWKNGLLSGSRARLVCGVFVGVMMLPAAGLIILLLVRRPGVPLWVKVSPVAFRRCRLPLGLLLRVALLVGGLR